MVQSSRKQRAASHNAANGSSADGRLIAGAALIRGGCGSGTGRWLPLAANYRQVLLGRGKVLRPWSGDVAGPHRTVGTDLGRGATDKFTPASLRVAAMISTRLGRPDDSVPGQTGASRGPGRPRADRLTGVVVIGRVGSGLWVCLGRRLGRSCRRNFGCRRRFGLRVHTGRRGAGGPLSPAAPPARCAPCCCHGAILPDPGWRCDQHLDYREVRGNSTPSRCGSAIAGRRWRDVVDSLPRVRRTGRHPIGAPGPLVRPRPATAEQACSVGPPAAADRPAIAGR
jgi:hypothetical protein